MAAFASEQLVCFEGGWVKIKYVVISASPEFNSDL